MPNKRIRKKIEARRLAQEAEVFVEAANPIVDVEREFQKEADQVLDQARILEQADNAVVNGVNGKPFKPEKIWNYCLMRLMQQLRLQTISIRGPMKPIVII